MRLVAFLAAAGTTTCLVLAACHDQPPVPPPQPPQPTNPTNLVLAETELDASIVEEASVGLDAANGILDAPPPTLRALQSGSPAR
jgi:hypothetical protein